MAKMTTQDLHEEIADALGELANLFVPGVKLTFIARFPGNDEADCLVGDDQDADQIIALVRRRFNQAPDAVPVPTSVNMARLMLAMGHRYLQETAPEHLAAPATSAAGKDGS